MNFGKPVAAIGGLDLEEGDLEDSGWFIGKDWIRSLGSLKTVPSSRTKN